MSVQFETHLLADFENFSEEHHAPEQWCSGRAWSDWSYRSSFYFPGWSNAPVLVSLVSRQFCLHFEEIGILIK